MFCLLIVLIVPAGLARGQARKAEIKVGVADGDMRGSDNRALQAAIDHVAGLGGGTVWIGPGCYEMRNALKLRSNVRVAGVQGKTILVSCPGHGTRLTEDGDCYERQIQLEDPSGFRVGDGVAIQDDHYKNGFEVTTATLTAQVDARTFRLSAPLYLDYLVSRKARACLAFPVIGGWNIHDAVVEGITVDGNREATEYIDGCRGGGIYLFESRNVTLRQCTVRAYHGDGISFQVSHDVTVEDCLVENNSGLGIHPGSGSQRPVVRRNRSIQNGDDGLYVCWRVKHGVFENNDIRGNKGAGVSIGHKDTDNLFRHNRIQENGKAGVLFREEAEAMGAHRNVFEANEILDNGRLEKGQGAAIVIKGSHHGLVFRSNTIGVSRPDSAGIGILTTGKEDLRSEENRFQNVKPTETATALKR
jgi:hypothetical protein